ncbi:ABC transporter substrate-binding protein [Millisia brevis]|uniref:ABC transporter substrate-binding protein n=1 Tax=Millisia brevis TaxID=264148 RepID=UPI000837887B|nr:iron-siderophore ABC transporter substrate-binding protein [Millisia brevis]
MAVRRITMSLGSILVATALTGALGACSADTDTTGSTDTASSSDSAASSGSTADSGFVAPRGMPEGKGSEAADGEFPRSVVHFAGTAEIPAAPERIVVIATGQADALLTLGLVPVGAAAGSGAEAVPTYLREQFPDRAADLDAITAVGDRSTPDVEAIGALEPDLILLNSAGDDDGRNYAAFSNIAPTVVTQGTGLYWKQDFALLADAVGKRDEALQWLDSFQSDAADVGANVDTGTTVSFTRLNGDRLRIFQVASFPGSVADDAGISRPESQQARDETSQDISPEELDRADATWLLYGVQGDPAELTDMPLWPTLGAVAADHAVSVDDDAFYLNAGPTAARVVLDQLQQTVGS